MDRKIAKEDILGVLAIVSLCAGSALILMFFPLDHYLWPGSRAITPDDKPLIWIAGAGLVVIGILIFMYLWRGIISFRPDKNSKRKRNWRI